MTKQWIIHKAKARRYKKRIWKQRHKAKKYFKQNFGSINLVYDTDLAKHKRELINKLKSNRFYESDKLQTKEEIGNIKKDVQIAPKLLTTMTNIESPKKSEYVFTIKTNTNKFFTTKLPVKGNKEIPLTDTGFVSDTQQEAENIHKRLEDETINRLKKDDKEMDNP